MINFNISPVALAQIETDEWLADRKPYEYQWKAYQLIRQAIESGETLCLFLVTPTGSGKTLTSYAHSIKTGLPMLGVYPTNELLADQERALLQEYQATGTNRIIRVDSATLDQWQIDLELKRHSQTLETILNYSPVLLTNPDILFYIIFGLYPEINSLRQRLWALVSSIYRLLIFDEFHLYNVKQQADTAFFIGALNAINPNVGRVFVFASATPNLEMVEILKHKLGLLVEVVELEPSQESSAHRIAHPVNLTLVPSKLEQWKGLATLDECFNIILSFQQQYPDARYVAIFDSVAAAIDATKRFRDVFTRNSVGEIHGLSSLIMRRESLAKKITVGTSTIEVGVDFKDEYEKDFLIFEARTSSQFLQRFGRIARHKKTISIPNQVLAFIPTYVYNFFVEKVGSENSLTRDELRNLLEEAYKQPEEFSRYLCKHASAEMTQSANLVLGMFQPDDKPRIVENISRVIESLTGKSYKQAQFKRREYEEKSILTPLLTFRGSCLAAAILDERGDDIGFPIKRYDMMFLLRRGIFQEMNEKEFLATLDRLELEQPKWNSEVSREKRFSQIIKLSPEDLLGVYGFFRLTGIIDNSDKTRQVCFEISEEDIMGKSRQIAVIKGLSIKTHPKIETRLLQKVLRQKQIVVWVIDKHPNSIKLGRALPPLFAIYELKVILPGGAYSSQSWSIAFNQNAFFLDSLLWNLKKPTEPIIL